MDFQAYVRSERASSAARVEKLWMNGAFPVDGLSGKKYFRDAAALRSMRTPAVHVPFVGRFA
jgi:hypothetical protein